MIKKWKEEKTEELQTSSRLIFLWKVSLFWVWAPFFSVPVHPHPPASASPTSWFWDTCSVHLWSRCNRSFPSFPSGLLIPSPADPVVLHQPDPCDLFSVCWMEDGGCWLRLLDVDSGFLILDFRLYLCKSQLTLFSGSRCRGWAFL